MGRFEDCVGTGFGGGGECGGEEGDGVAIWARAETGVEDVVGAGHAFYDVAGEVGVDSTVTIVRTVFT